MAEVDEMEKPDLGVEEARAIVDAEPTKPTSPYDWETDVEQTDAETADPLNPNYVAPLFDENGDATPDCPYFVSPFGEKKDTFRPSKKPIPMTFNSNNGMINFVDETGAVYAVKSGDEASLRLEEKGYQGDSSMTVYLSNGEYCGSKEGNERLASGERIKQSKKMGLTIESMSRTSIDGSVEYTPSLQTSEEYIGTLEAGRTKMLEQIAELQAAPAGEDDIQKHPFEGTYSVKGAEIERLQEEARKLEELIAGRRVLESVGVPVSPELNQINYDLGRYSVVTDTDGQEVIRYVDCHGRYMQAPHSGMAVETLEKKGYRQKAEVINNGISSTTSQVSAPRVKNK